MKETDFESMYWKWHDEYNPYPYQESRCTIFGKALADGRIDQETYNRARAYYKELWMYVGD